MMMKRLPPLPPLSQLGLAAGLPLPSFSVSAQQRTSNGKMLRLCLSVRRHAAAQWRLSIQLDKFVHFKLC